MPTKIKHKMVLIKSRNTGQWGYCPEETLPLMGKIMEYSDEETNLKTPEEAMQDAINHWKLNPKTTEFRIIQPQGY